MVDIKLDGHKLMYHPKRISEWMEKGDCYPIYVEIGATNLCNHRCIFCALDFLKEHSDFIDKGIMISSLKDMAEHGVKSVMFAGEGESLLHKDICEFVQKAKEFGMDVAITTNGVPLTKEKITCCLPSLSWIRFSVDSGAKENYSLIHGTLSQDFEKVIDNIREAVIFRNLNNLKTTIGVQFLVIPQNIDQTIKLAKILREIGVDNLQIKPYSHHPDSLNNLQVSPIKYNQIEDELLGLNTDKFKILFRKSTFERTEEKEVPYNLCHGLPFFALITAKGDVIPCNLYYGNQDFTYGNLYKNSFSEIWEGEKRKQIIGRINKKGIQECRKLCRLDVINRYFERLKNPDLHDNFI